MTEIAIGEIIISLILNKEVDFAVIHKISETVEAAADFINHLISKNRHDVVEQVLTSPVIRSLSTEKMFNYLYKCITYSDIRMFEMFADKCNILEVANYRGTKYQDTLLIYATFCRNVEVVEYLLKIHGIDVNIKNKLGNTALYYAINRDARECLYLLATHIDINLFDIDAQHNSVFGFIINPKILNKYNAAYDDAAYQPKKIMKPIEIKPIEKSNEKSNEKSIEMKPINGIKKSPSKEVLEYLDEDDYLPEYHVISNDY